MRCPQVAYYRDRRSIDVALDQIAIPSFFPAIFMPESPVLPLLFVQLQARYPTSGLLTELVQLETDRCVVRALVQLGSITLATSMATAATVEQAEDQARLRVLALLGIRATPLFSVPDISVPDISVPDVSLSSHSTPTQTLPHTFQDKAQVVDALNDAVFQDITPANSTLPAVEAIAPPLPFPTRIFDPTATLVTPVAAADPYATAPTVTDDEPETFDDAPDSDDASYNKATYAEEPFEESEPMVKDASSDDRAIADIAAPAAEEPAPKSKPRKPNADKAPPVSETDTSGSASTGSPSRDLSSLISQIGVEIDRIGWSKRQGSTYLQKTYGKKTRSELTDDELEDFLTYLNTQPPTTTTL